MNPILTHTIENTWLDGLCPHGWGNGYVGVPKGHPWYGLEYEKVPADVHGGLTFGSQHVKWDLPPDYHWFGFDTCHWGDNADNCTEAYVKTETERLADQARAAVSQPPSPPLQGAGTSSPPLSHIGEDRTA